MIQISTDLFKAKKILEKECLVAIPTETVYGLAGNIYSDKAIKNIFKTKNRPYHNPLIVHIHSLEILPKIVKEIPEKAKKLAEVFWPGSLTLVLKKSDSVPSIISAGKETVAVRIPNHPLTLELLKNLDFPLAAPSANPFGSISPTTSEHVVHYFKDQLEMVLEGGACSNGIESTIVGFENEEVIIYRLGSISVEEIESVVGPIKIKNKNNKSPNAPGMLSKHYAPKTKTILTENIKAEIINYPDSKIGVLLFNDLYINEKNIEKEILSNNWNLKEASANLYAALHRLDEKGLDIIIAEKFPENDLGKSINDRLERATKN
jgi:L-threonylcarbamoyladenylate synthase